MGDFSAITSKYLLKFCAEGRFWMSWTKKAELGHDFELSYAICTRFLLQISEKFYK